MSVNHPEERKKSRIIPDERMVKTCDGIKTPKTIKLNPVKEHGWDVNKWKQTTISPKSTDFYRQKYGEGFQKMAAQWAVQHENTIKKQ